MNAAKWNTHFDSRWRERENDFIWILFIVSSTSSFLSGFCLVYAKSWICYMKLNSLSRLCIIWCSLCSSFRFRVQILAFIYARAHLCMCMLHFFAHLPTTCSFTEEFRSCLIRSMYCNIHLLTFQTFFCRSIRTENIAQWC